MVDAARAVFSGLAGDVFIYTDHVSGAASGRCASPPDRRGRPRRSFAAQCTHLFTRQPSVHSERWSIVRAARAFLSWTVFRGQRTDALWMRPRAMHVRNAQVACNIAYAVPCRMLQANVARLHLRDGTCLLCTSHASGASCACDHIDPRGSMSLWTAMLRDRPGRSAGYGLSLVAETTTGFAPLPIAPVTAV